jgi:hypothetical protein
MDTFAVAVRLRHFCQGEWAVEVNNFALDNNIVILVSLRCSGHDRPAVFVEP